MEIRESPLDDAQTAAFAWSRYKRRLGWMALVASVATLICLAWLWMTVETMTIHMLIATGLGTFVSVMLMAALMGLVFLSSGTGHDEAIEHPFGEDA